MVKLCINRKGSLVARTQSHWQAKGHVTGHGATQANKQKLVIGCFLVHSSTVMRFATLEVHSTLRELSWASLCRMRLDNIAPKGKGVETSVN